MDQTTTSAAQQTISTPPSKAQDRRKIIADLLAAVEKQEDLVKQLCKDLEFYRDKYQKALDYVDGWGNHLADIGGETAVGLRAYTDLGNGVIGAETAADHVGYVSAMDNAQLGLEKAKEEIERIWGVAGEVVGVDNGGPASKDPVKIASWRADLIEKGRKAAVKE